MEPYQERVVEEKKELDVKLRALDDFLESETFDGLDNAQQYLLRKQSQHMESYSHVLGERIAAFK